MNAIFVVATICIVISSEIAIAHSRFLNDHVASILDELEKEVEDMVHKRDELLDNTKKEEHYNDLVDLNERKYHRTIDMKRNPVVPLNAATKDYLWTKGADGVVRIPYVMGPRMASDIVEQIEKAVKYMNGITCSTGPKWIKRTNEENYIEFIMDGGCYSYIGYTRYPKQPISIDRGCETIGTIAHEMLHAMGFDHEQSRPDRDNYVKVNLQNVKRENWPQFEKVERDAWSDMNLKYDYKSVMHYESKDFSKNGKPVIVPAKGSTFTGEFGTRNALTKSDEDGLNILYGCKKSPTTSTGSPRSTDSPRTDSTGPTDSPGTDSTGPTDSPGTDSTGPTDSPGTDSTGPTDSPGTDGTGSTDSPGTDSTGPTDSPGTDRTGSTDDPVTYQPWTTRSPNGGNKMLLKKMNKKIDRLMRMVAAIKKKIERTKGQALKRRF